MTFILVTHNLAASLSCVAFFTLTSSDLLLHSLCGPQDGWRRHREEGSAVYLTRLVSAEGGKRKELNKHSLELDGGVRERLSSQEGASLTCAGHQEAVLGRR